MAVRFAFVGFRHPHIFDMYQRCCALDGVQVVACCEEHAATRERLRAEGQVQLTHESYERLLERVDCDVIAVGDCYGRREEIILAALRCGRHVIGDKPLCISLEQLEQIQTLAGSGRRVVGCMLDMRDLPVYLGFRDTIRSGAIGQVQAISFDGQHPLMYGRRPDWYFQPGMHGGVLNDIAIHAVDFIPWATGQAIGTVVAARTWNATLPEQPHFQQCGQAMFTLENGAGVIGDVSYLTPDTFGYDLPLYWRFTVWGSDGVLEAAVNSRQLLLYRNGDSWPRELPLPPPRPGAYLNAFLAELAGQTEQLHLSSQEVFRAARIALLMQEAADEKRYGVSVC